MKTILPARWGVKLLVTGLFVGLDLIGLTATAAAASQAEITQMIAEEAAKNGRVPLPMALAVAKVESDFREDALSTAGARGVMQIMPATAMSEFGVPASALGDPRLNVKLGIAYLERLHNRYGGNWELALSHYNGGTLPAAAGQYVAHDYTHQYVADVMKWAAIYRNDQTMMARATPGTAPAVDLASAEAQPMQPTMMARAKPETPAEAQAMPPPLAAVPDRHADQSYPSIAELRERFRASLDHRREAAAGPADTAAPADGDAAQPRRGRFSYAAYGS
jgi:Transglycosylase SLT domain